MKHILNILLFIVFPFLMNAQQSYPDSLRNVLETTSIDSIQYDLNIKPGDFYEEKNLDSPKIQASKSNCYGK